jgi:hypothetical protein
MGEQFLMRAGQEYVWENGGTTQRTRTKNPRSVGITTAAVLSGVGFGWLWPAEQTNWYLLLAIIVTARNRIANTH